MRRRTFLTSVATIAASNFALPASTKATPGLLSLRPFDWRDALNRTNVAQLAISQDTGKIALQVTQPLSAGGPFAEAPWARPNLDLRGAIWLLSESLGSPRCLISRGNGVWAPSFSPDGRSLAALTLAGPGKVGIVIWDLERDEYRHFLDHNVEIYFAAFRSASSAYAAVAPYPIPHRYLWLDSKSILFVDHGQIPQQFFLSHTDLSYTLQALRNRTLRGQSSVRVWGPQSQTCGKMAKLVKLDCTTGRVETLYNGDVRGVSVSPDLRSAALLTAVGVMQPVPNARIDAPLDSDGMGDPMVRLNLALVDIVHGGKSEVIKGVTAVGDVGPQRLPVWSEDGDRFAVPVRTVYSDKWSTGNDYAWEVVRNTGHANEWRASSALDAELLSVMLTTEGINNEAAIDQRPAEARPSQYADWWHRSAGVWRCSPTEALLWNAPSLTVIGSKNVVKIPGRFSSVWPPVSNDVRAVALAVHDNQTVLINTLERECHSEVLQARPEWSPLGVRLNDAGVIYQNNSSSGTYLKLVRPRKRPCTSALTFNTYFRNIARPHDAMLACRFPDGTFRKGLLQLPIGHERGDRHPVIVYAYPNFSPSLHSSVARINSETSVVFPIQYLLANGFAFFHAPFPISGENSRNPMRSAAEAVLPWLDVLDRQTVVIPGEYGCWGHSNAGYVALALEALTNRFKAIVACSTFPEIGFSDLHSNAFVVALNCGGSVVQSWRAQTEAPEVPYAPQPVLSWKNPAEYIHNDPLFNLKRASTPILLIVGEFDESPRETEETYSILHARGVPVELAYYWGEGHVFSSPGNIRDSWIRTYRFFKKYLQT